MQIPGAAPVVVGVNGTASGLAAVRLAAREAVTRGQPLRIVHAFTWPGARSHNDPPDYGSARHDAEMIVQRAAATAERSVPGVRVGGLLVDGQPVRELLRQSRTASLLVLGDDDLAATHRLPDDSVLVQTVARARCPVLVARGIRPQAGPLLVAVDRSACSEGALRLAADESLRRRVPLEVVHVVTGPAGEPSGRRLLASAVRGLAGPAGVRARLLVGEPGPTLVRASRSARMMIVGPRGAGSTSLLGAVAGELLRRCACPTMFVHGIPAARGRDDGTVPTADALMS
ncbi:universal stress protein [Couchioplanes caeruleus]|uniref:universal stress protein n=1 Tax=Couchioplanes caeruleus TaxID=56438 RepID=UPI0020BF2E4E|nr:universal stress protein [Couchioplanes caeruleus]UQU68049.1 universal stress protein [Couchioplanes caeruleus]